MNSVDVLAEMANLLEQGGWCQNAFFDPKTGGRCVLGALNYIKVSGPFVTVEELDEHLEQCHMAQSAIEVEIDGGIPDWNDTPGRTKEEVVTTIRNAKRHL